MKRILSLTILLLLIGWGISFATVLQKKESFTIKGIIMDRDSKETLAGVPIGIKEIPSKATSSDVSGSYSITLQSGKYTLLVSYVGYETQEIKITVDKNLEKNISLSSSSVNLNEVVVSSRKADENVTAVQTGVERIDIQEINKLPVLMGERDIIKSLQLMPGVKSTGDGSSGMFVRGGSVDQNLILLDNVALYNASHLMGFFSTFNSDVVRDAVLYKGALPAQYGERLASILDVQQRNGDIEKLGVTGGIGLISSKLSLEGPIQKGKSSFIVGARRTYADAIARMSGVKEATDAYLYFYDLNAKANIWLSNKDQLTFSAYFGKDKMVLKDAANTDWGNQIAALKWSHVFSNKWSSATTFTYNKYQYNAHADFGTNMDAEADIMDLGFKQEFVFLPSATNTWKFGVQATRHRLNPGDLARSTSKINLHNRYALENAAYLSNQIQLTDNLEIIYGLRLSAFSAMGKGEYYTLDDNRNVTDSTWYGSKDVVKTYINLEPRVSMAYKLDKSSSIKAAYARTTQNMHLLTYSATGTPYDRWTMSSNNVKPQIGDQYSLGYFRNFKDNAYEFSVEAYYKHLKNQLDFVDNADFEGYNVIETELLAGKGRAYGIELLLKKKKGRLTGWISYTLSKSEKQINGINDDRWYDTYQDRTHDISIVGMYDLNKKWSLSAAWIYYTGNALTYPSGKYQIDGKDVMYYAERNGYRAPAYHRLDLGATCKLKQTRKFSSELVFSLYNAYGRENAYMIDFRTNDDDPDKTTAYQYALFRFVPSVSWNFKF
ncbi:TonB-dependent receptor [Dysgonomonas capnocytophagoides]|uniref:TonB-dependent receptor n=1 Tax=Dysgonomonas capnocytophagoides TaxID=45254 RepID=UPI00333FC917